MTSEKNASASNVGVIVKGIGGFYYVYSDGEIYECRARGKFRLDGLTPLPGDRVGFEPGENRKGGFVTAIFDRTNQLKRPPVANVDQLVLVLSASRPRPDLILADKLLIQAQRQRIDAMLVLNKCDVAESDVVRKIEENYPEQDFLFCCTSAMKKSGLDALEENLNGKLSCFAGQSAVGKSSLLNALSQSFSFDTGEISRKTGRGRHTTRAVELRTLSDEANSFIMDTPGFSMLELDVQPEKLPSLYPEMDAYAGQCRFDNCLHVNEPDCAIKAAVLEGTVPRGRYERYLIILKELQDREARRY